MNQAQNPPAPLLPSDRRAQPDGLAQAAGTPDARRQLASLTLAVVVITPDRMIACVNPAAESFFGQSSRRLIGRSLHNVLRFIDTRVEQRLAEHDAPLSARQVDGVVTGYGVRRLDVNTAPVVDWPGWQVLSLHDGAGVEAMGESAAGDDDLLLRAPEVLAHEIKNPLAGIRGAAQLLARKLKSEDLALTSLITDEVDRVAKLIDQMQTLSQRTAEPTEPCNLHEAVRRAIAVLVAGDSTVAIEEEFDPSLPLILGHKNALVQVLLNLMVNAREAARHRPDPRVMVRTRFASGLLLHTAGDGAPLRLPIELRVSDNGPGIDPALRDHLFEPFVTSKRSGRGLGLALVRKMVRDMNGRITHDRDDVAGWTHFRVHLAWTTADAKRILESGPVERTFL